MKKNLIATLGAGYLALSCAPIERYAVSPENPTQNIEERVVYEAPAPHIKRIQIPEKPKYISHPIIDLGSAAISVRESPKGDMVIGITDDCPSPSRHGTVIDTYFVNSKGDIKHLLKGSILPHNFNRIGACFVNPRLVDNKDTIANALYLIARNKNNGNERYSVESVECSPAAKELMANELFTTLMINASHPEYSKRPLGDTNPELLRLLKLPSSLEAYRGKW